MDSWMTEYYNLADLGTRILEQLNKRDQKQRSRANITRINEDIRSMLSAYNKSLLSLKTSLARASTAYHITDREYERRQQLLDELTSKQRQYEKALNSLDGHSSASDVSTRAPLNPFGPSSPSFGEETSATRNTDNATLRQEQQRIIEEQDRGLEALSQALRRQKDMGVAIGNEVEYQTGLIEDLGSETERVDVKIQRETRRIEKTTRKSGNIILWCIALLLFIIIIIFMSIPRQ